MEIYRGTQHQDVKGIQRVPSYTDSLPVAIIWSSTPPDQWTGREAKFIPTSTVHRATLNAGKMLELSDYNYESFSMLLQVLKHGKADGITTDEALKVLTYMNNRLLGRVPGGEFKYTVRDEDGELETGENIQISFVDPTTIISEFRDVFEWDPSREVADRLEADTFIFADSKTVQKVARRLGFDALSYVDVFMGGEFVSQKLLGIAVEDLNGVLMGTEIEGDAVPTHMTYRPLVEGAVTPVESILTAELLLQVSPSELRK